MSPDKSFIKYAIPILQALRDKGGQLRLAESIEAAAERLGLASWQLDQAGANGEPTIRTDLTWARAHLISWGYLTVTQPDQVRLTASGVAASDTGSLPATEQLFNDSQRHFVATLQAITGTPAAPASSQPVAAAASTAAASPAPTPIPAPAPAAAATSTPTMSGLEGLPTSRDLGTVPGNELLPILDSLNPEVLARLTTSLLSQQGFTDVQITERLDDGSMSAIGTLAINRLVGLKGMLHIKKTQVPISRALIREFRGTLAGRASKGIFITTGRFSPEAIEEAGREGVDPIDLLDGIQLVRLLEELEIVVKARTVYDLDPLFFEL
ncbi:MAG: hypothetical protein RLZZ624_1108 [Cyanobacteriota bacterium]|jgi:restriction system protein